MSNRRRAAVAAAGICAVLLAANAGLSMARSEDRVARVSGEIVNETAVSLDTWADASRVPVMPIEPLTTVEEGQPIIIGAVAGLSDVSARLNGTSLKVSRERDAFVIRVGSIDGTGAAEIVIEERFDDGSRVSVPFTVYANPTPTAAVAAESELRSASSASTVVVGWEHLGVTDGVEGDTVGPQAIAALDDGRIAILDTVNSRVLGVDPSGEVSTLTRLPTASFIDLVGPSAGGRVLAIDSLNALAVDVSTGVVETLPPLVARLPLGLDYSLDAAGTLFVTNPGDGAEYSIARDTGRALDASGSTTRRLDSSRLWLDRSMLNIQRDAEAAPVAVDLGAVESVSVYDKAELGGGRVAVLVETRANGADSARTEILTLDGTTVRSIPVEFNPGVLMGNPMTVTGSTLTIANPTDQGLALTSIAL